MKWIDLTDILFFRANDYLFTIIKPEYRHGIIYWHCTKDKEIIEQGKTTKMTEAKNMCKDLYQRLNVNA